MDEEEQKDFCIEHAKTGRAACKKCKRFCEKGELRIARLVPNHFSDDGGKLKHWHHVDCLFEAFKTQRATTKKIESVDDIEGWYEISEEEREAVLAKIEKCGGQILKTTKKSPASPAKASSSNPTDYLKHYNENSKDNLFCTFCQICDKIANVSGYIQKSNLLKNFLLKGINGKNFEGDIYLWLQMLLPSTIKRVYNLKSRQLVKLFSRVFIVNQQEMLTDLEQGDVAETIKKYFGKSKYEDQNPDSYVTMKEINILLEELSQLTKEDDQIKFFQKLCSKCNADDVKMVIRLINNDLRINAGPRHILDALHPEAYKTFQLSCDLRAVVEKYADLISENKLSPKKDADKQKASGVQVMTPVSPMLAEACKSVENAILKNPEGIYSEIKYDGERVQIHKQGDEFRFFSRNLKPVMNHKISRCKDFIPKAFPGGYDLILDSEIIVVDTRTGKLLPFGTLGVHRKEKFASSEVCLFVFDCIYYNGEDLTNKPLSERKEILKKNINPIKHHVQLSEYYLVKTEKQLALMTARVLKTGLEGLVLKSINSLYQPGKRGWLKIKKDYLFEGQMADTADLVVLGAWFGSGKKGGMLSIFLMGCYDTDHNVWNTVTKVHSGLDDNEMATLQDKLKKLMERCNSDKPPKWILCKKMLIPDYIAIDPFSMPVWEITGAEFTKADVHTADGISIRFPRITKFREDKSPKEATTLNELKELFKTSKDHVNVDMLVKDVDIDEKDVEIKTKFYNLGQGEDNSSFEEDTKFRDKPGQSRSRRQLAGPSSEIIAEKEEKKLKENKEKLNKAGNKSSFEDDTNRSYKKFKASTSPNKVADEIKLNEYEKDKEESKLFTDVKEEVTSIKNAATSIFEGVKLYVPLEVDEKFAPAVKKFRRCGGEVTEISLDATHAIHLTNKNDEDFECLRNKYSPECRHLTYNWIFQSIVDKKYLAIQDYGVYL